MGFGEVDAEAPQATRELAARLQQVAQRAGYSGVRALAAGSRVSRTTVSDAMAARRVPTWQTLAALLRGCDVVPDGDWAKALEAAKDAFERDKQMTKDLGHPTESATNNQVGTVPVPASPGTFSIRPPYGELPPRLRGREDLLHDLESRLAEGSTQIQVLHGLGGCGKTSVALYLARQARDQGYSVYWLSALTPDRFATGMREVARSLGADEALIEAAWTGRTSATDLVWRLLDAAEQPWLLIVDNADEPAWLASGAGLIGDGTGWLRSSQAGMTVVTSRTGNPDVWGRESQTHRIEVLAPPDAGNILLDLAGEAGDPADALVLAERLEGLPLALKLAGSYLARAARGAGLLRRRGQKPGRVKTFAAYTEALGEVGAGFLDLGEKWYPDDTDQEHKHRRLIGRTWEMSLDLLDEQQLPKARTLMRLLSCFAPVPFPVELLDTFASQNTPSDPDAELEQADQALEALIDLSLLDVIELPMGGADTEAESVPCLVSHRLVLEANALRLADSTEEERIAVWNTTSVMLECGATREPEYPQNWPWWRLMVPHTVAALKRVPDIDAPLRRLLAVGLKAYAYYNFSQVFDQADELAKLLLERASKLSADDPIRLSVCHRAALSLLKGEAQLSEFERVLAKQLEYLGPEHPETLITRHNVVTARPAGPATADHEAEIRSVLEARRRTLGADNPYTLITHVELSYLIASRGHEGNASEDEFDLLIGRTLGGSAPDSDLLPLANRHRLAHVLDDAKRWPEAEAEYRAMLTIVEKYGDRDSGFYRSMMRCLVSNLRKQRKYEDAVSTLTDLFRWYGDQKSPGWPTAPWALHIRHARADVLRLCGQAAEAEKEMRNVLTDRLMKTDLNDSVILDERHCLAHSMMDQEKITEAHKELRSIVASYAEILGPGEYATRRALTCLAKSLHGAGEHAEAVLRYEELFQAEIDALGENHTQALATHLRLERCRLESGQQSPQDAVSAMQGTLSRDLPTLTQDYPKLVKKVQDLIESIRPHSAVGQAAPRGGE
ncbi:AAA family ATPase [Streptomyces sp. NPDC088733]|uniref:AAA family ATPase n=1 Tax=Streptomyces sp. NPDC088733 TaxID=3365880 RepID=UPI0038202F18